ncbi:hypothetical protein GGX14DRAFT_663335 [Mycena pura]|uniref:Uncharacterized protein n=1 Tax=Mycena pura TaxID=153505 RepID=A0AAD6YKW6_9AGAR|nr:hypothetical protein GGX14DRAFT_663335 [Mycena pura]
MASHALRCDAKGDMRIASSCRTNETTLTFATPDNCVLRPQHRFIDSTRVHTRRFDVRVSRRSTVRHLRCRSVPPTDKLDARVSRRSTSTALLQRARVVEAPTNSTFVPHAPSLRLDVRASRSQSATQRIAIRMPLDTRDSLLRAPALALSQQMLALLQRSADSTCQWPIRQVVVVTLRITPLEGSVDPGSSDALRWGAILLCGLSAAVSRTPRRVRAPPRRPSQIGRCSVYHGSPTGTRVLLGRPSAPHRDTAPSVSHPLRSHSFWIGPQYHYVRTAP